MYSLFVMHLECDMWSYLHTALYHSGLPNVKLIGLKEELDVVCHPLSDSRYSCVCTPQHPGRWLSTCICANTLIEYRMESACSKLSLKRNSTSWNQQRANRQLVSFMSATSWCISELVHETSPEDVTHSSTETQKGRDRSTKRLLLPLFGDDSSHLRMTCE